MAKGGALRRTRDWVEGRAPRRISMAVRSAAPNGQASLGHGCAVYVFPSNAVGQTQRSGGPPLQYFDSESQHGQKGGARLMSRVFS